MLMFFTPNKKCHRLKAAEAVSICEYSALCRGYISAMFAFVAIATDVWPSQITSSTQWLTPSYSAHARSVHATHVTAQVRGHSSLLGVFFLSCFYKKCWQMLKTILRLHSSCVSVRWGKNMYNLTWKCGISWLTGLWKADLLFSEIIQTCTT